MHLESLKPQVVTIAHRDIHFDAGETIHTEISRKFDLPKFLDLVGTTGWTLSDTWMDKRDYFAVLLLSAT